MGIVDLVVWLAAILHVTLAATLIGNLLFLRRSRPANGPQSVPKISVLIPARNEANNLRRLIPSLLTQRYADFEVIVVDDASEDETWTVLSSFADARLRLLKGDGPPPGWVGKVHALYQATREATGDVYLFVDADGEFLHEAALVNLMSAHKSMPKRAAMTGMTRLLGRGHILVSMVTHAMLVAVPWFLLRRLPPSFAALNGQCWMIDAGIYKELEPHAAHKNEILEDVRIGRFLARNGVTPVLADVQDHFAIHMYSGIADAWQGFRKNAYLIMGGTVPRFLLSLLSYWLVYLAGPILSWWLCISLFVMKAATDFRTRFSWLNTLLLPVSFVLGAVMQFSSAIAHWRKQVDWKGRIIEP